MQHDIQERVQPRARRTATAWSKPSQWSGVQASVSCQQCQRPSCPSTKECRESDRQSSGLAIASQHDGERQQRPALHRDTQREYVQAVMAVLSTRILSQIHPWYSCATWSPYPLNSNVARRLVSPMRRSDACDQRGATPAGSRWQRNRIRWGRMPSKRRPALCHQIDLYY